MIEYITLFGYSKIQYFRCQLPISRWRDVFVATRVGAKNAVGCPTWLRMTTWAQPVRHPWYNPPSLKRRLSASDDDDDNGVSYSAVLPSPSHRKRIRHNSLERTLAHMTLGSATATSEDVDMWPKVSPPHPHDQASTNVIFPSSVQEPTEPDDMDVEPTGQSRHVFIHVSCFDSGSVVMTDTFTGDAGQLDVREVHISTAALECIKQRLRPIIPLPPGSRALVLYRAPRPPSPDSAQASILVAQEEDVMEVE